MLIDGNGPGSLVPGQVAPHDPERFVAAALHHKVAGFASVAIESRALVLPTEHGRRLARAGALEIVRSRVQRTALGELAPALAAACEVSPILLKGPAVADRFYPDPRLRPFVDLDLLVPRERLSAAIEAARALGYESLDQFRPGFAESHGHAVQVRRRAGARSVSVDLHWRVGDDRLGEALDHHRLAASANSLMVGGTLVAVPALPEQLLCLAVHLLSDRAKCLAWVHDQALVATSATDTEWRWTFELARELGLVWVLHRALDYSERFLGFARKRPLGPGPPPAWGPLRAVEDLDARAALHVGRLATLRWGQRPRYLWTVLVPSRAGLRGTVGRDGAPTWRLVGRHVRATLTGLGSRRP